MSNNSNTKADETLYNTLESPQRCQLQRNVPADTVNDYDYTNLDESSYQKLNPTNAVAKNMYSSLVTASSSSNNTQIPQDYLTPIKEHFKMSNVVPPAEDKKEDSKKQYGTYFCILLLLTCISLLVATAAVILAVLALSKVDNTIDMASPGDKPPAMVTVTEEVRDSLNESNSVAGLDKKLLGLYINITSQLSMLTGLINDVESTSSMLSDEVKLIKGNINNLNNVTRWNQRVILTRTTEIATLGFKLQDLTTELNKLKELSSQQTAATTNSPALKIAEFPLISQVYTQWGKQSCSSEGTTPVYTGYAAGPGSFRPTNSGRQQDISLYGGGTNMLCLTNTPSLRGSHDAPSTAATVYAAQYLNDSITLEQPRPMPCSVCEAHNTSVIMTIPGSDKCPVGWTMEYNGFIMGQSSRVGRASNFEESQYICVDDSFDSYPGARPLQQNRRDTATFMSIVKVDCDQGIPCGDSSYSSTSSLTCAVCSKRISQ